MTTPKKRPTRSATIEVKLPAPIAREFRTLAQSLGIKSPESAMREAVRCFFSHYGRAELAMTSEAGPINDKPFADHLKDWRARNKLTAEQASPILGVNKRTLENWTAGRNRPTQAMERLLLGLMARHGHGQPDQI